MHLRELWRHTDSYVLTSYLVWGNILNIYESQFLNLYNRYIDALFAELLGILVAMYGKHKAELLAHSIH